MSQKNGIVSPVGTARLVLCKRVANRFAVVSCGAAIPLSVIQLILTSGVEGGLLIPFSTVVMLVVGWCAAYESCRYRTRHSRQVLTPPKFAWLVAIIYVAILSLFTLTLLFKSFMFHCGVALVAFAFSLLSPLFLLRPTSAATPGDPWTQEAHSRSTL